MRPLPSQNPALQTASGAWTGSGLGPSSPRPSPRWVAESVESCGPACDVCDCRLHRGIAQLPAWLQDAPIGAMTIEAFVEKMLPLLDMEREAEMEQQGGSIPAPLQPRPH